ncbi:MAG: succinate--CoA ligase subunit alpha [Syntrophorhabdaceae bacterium]|nr:succinate--CoA ligase subunit alpha [Syntrophorhabdaceae bacterium]MDD4195589.1 succinate--CoA ligase subunit alpha [Syntrophorhabdaceae bacterium]HOC46827.1 succinate--CoA ligase subunit alpha [Syntrophorhabdaceae bacterium]
MSILMNDSTRVIVQGITGRIGSAQTHWMLEYGTRVVGGVTPGKGGMSVEGVPVFNSVLEAVKETGANSSVFFVPAAGVLDAFLETIDAGVKLIVIVPEHIPVKDVLKMRSYALEKGVFALGPTTPGLLVPGMGKMGIMPASLFQPGRVGIISRSGTLSYEFAGILSESNVGQSTVVGMGADPVVLRNLADILELFENDPGTDAVIIVGEVGGEQEEKAAGFIARKMTKPVATYIAGRYSPQGKKMGHAGAIVRGSTGTVAGKHEALRTAGATILESPIDVAKWAKKNKLR